MAFGDLARQDDYGVDPLTGAPFAPAPEAQGKFGRIADAIVGGLRNWVETPGRAYKEGLSREEAADWGAGTAFGMIAGSKLPGGAAGSGMTKLPLLKGKPGGPWEGGIRAYHSSPHDFEKVDFSKLRTGEGANVYGAGHYMAENPAVSGQGGQYWQNFLHRFGSQEGGAAKLLAEKGFDREQVLKVLAREIESAKAEPLTKMFGEVAKQSHLDQLLARQRLLESGQPVGPRTYEMNLRAKPEELLDWDKGLHRQSPQVQRALEPFGFRVDHEGMKRFDDALLSGLHDPSPSDTFGSTLPFQPRDPSGSQIYHKLAPSNQERASAMLRDAGIPGIRYLDEGSRISSPDQIKAIRENIAHREALLADRPGDPTNTKWLSEYRDMLKRAENPTYNYVGTDPSKLDVLAKYGLASGATGFGTLAAQDSYKQ